MDACEVSAGGNADSKKEEANNGSPFQEQVSEKHVDVNTKAGVGAPVEEPVKKPQEGGDGPESAASAPFDNADEDEDAAVLLEKIETLKGDRIGETMYSERFVLSTVLKLSQRADKLLEDDEEFERDLCNLWDMTIEPDVVRFLLQQEVIELFLALASNSKDYRLIEILFGIVGNMCCVSEMHDYMYQHKDLLLSLCDFLDIPDAPVLVQLMRTLTTLFDRSDDERYRWFDVMKSVDNLTEKLALILASSANRALLEHTIETISAIINRFTEAEVDYAQLKEFYVVFGKSCLPVGMFEAFRQLYPAAKGPADNDASNNGFDEDVLTLKDVKTMRRMLEIHEHFIVNANELYEPHVDDVVQCVYRVLVSFVSESMLFPLTKNHVSIFVSINNIYSGIMYHFHCDSFVCMVRIYELLMKTVPAAVPGAQASPAPAPPQGSPMQAEDATHRQPEEEEEQDEDEEQFDTQTACGELLETIFYLVGPIDEQIIRDTVRQHRLHPATIEQLCQGMREAMDGEPLLYQSCAKLTNAVRMADDVAMPLQSSNGHETAQRESPTNNVE